MSRFIYWDLEPEDIRYNNLWRGNVKRALRGRRGQQWLRELRAVLLALPEKRLIEGALCEYGIDDNDEPEKPEFCVIGALAYQKRVAAGESPSEVIRDLGQYKSDDCLAEEAIEKEGKRIGLGPHLARHIAWQNDEKLGDLTPEQRYAEMLVWVESQIIPEGP